MQRAYTRLKDYLDAGIVPGDLKRHQGAYRCGEDDVSKVKNLAAPGL
jgi:hypothetical protein